MPASAPSPPPSSRSSLRLTPATLSLALLALSSLGADVSPCGRARRPLPPVAPPAPAAAPVAAASSAQADPEAVKRCCRQCAAASARDPAGMDLSVLPCTRYRPGGGAPGGSEGLLEASCAELLASKKLLIGACQQLAAP